MGGAPTTVQVTIQNIGNVAASGFWVSLFIDSDPGVNKYYPPAYEDPQFVSSLGAGETRTITWTGYFYVGGWHYLYVYVDSRGPSNYYGAVWETNEENNLSNRKDVLVQGFWSGESDEGGMSSDGWGERQQDGPEKMLSPFTPVLEPTEHPVSERVPTPEPVIVPTAPTEEPAATATSPGEEEPPEPEVTAPTEESVLPPTESSEPTGEPPSE